MKWFVLTDLAVMLLLGIIALIGSKLPVNHKASRKAAFRQTPDAIYATIAGPPDWRSGVKAWGALEPIDGRRRWWEQDSHGKKVTFELVEDAAPRRRAIRIADKDLPYGGTWTFDIAPAAQGAELRITEDGQVYNVFFRFLSRFVFGHTGSIESFLRDLGKKYGEQPRIEA